MALSPRHGKVSVMNPFRRKVPLPNNQSFDATKYPERWVNPPPPTEPDASESSVSSPTLGETQKPGPSQPLPRVRRLLKQSSFSAIVPPNLKEAPGGQEPQWMELVRRRASESNIRVLDYTKAFEASQQQPGQRRRATSLSAVGHTDYTRAEEAAVQLSQGRKRSSLTSIRPLALDASSPQPRLRRSSSFSTLEPSSHLHSSAARTIDYTKPSRTSSFSNIETSPHLHSSSARAINYTKVSDQGRLRRNLSLPHESSSQLHSSSARTIDYTRISDHDQVRRNPLLSRSRSLDYTRHGKTVGQTSQFASTSSSPNVRALDFTHFAGNGEEPSQIDSSRKLAAFSKITVIPEEEYTVYRPNYGK